MKRHVFILLVFRPFRKKHVTSLQAKRVSRRWLVWIEAVGALYSIFEERGKNETLSSPSKFNSELCDKTEISTRSTASSMKYFIFFPQLHPILNWTKVNACCNFLEKRIKLLGGEVRGCDVSTENSWASLAETTWADGMPRCVCKCACVFNRGQNNCTRLAAGLSQPLAMGQWGCLVGRHPHTLSVRLLHTCSYSLTASWEKQ